MKSIKLALIGLALGSATTVAAECMIPDVPEMPDGATSSHDDMIAGQGAVKAYQAANLEYMSCLDPKIATANEAAEAKSATDEDKATAKALGEAYNTAVSMEEELADHFNAEIGEYKAANPG